MVAAVMAMPRIRLSDNRDGVGPLGSTRMVAQLGAVFGGRAERFLLCSACFGGRKMRVSEAEKLERGLGLIEATSLNMTFMVGIGPFVVIPFVIQAMGGPGSLVAWAAGALLAVFDGCIWAELGAAMPQAGGSYVYLREAYGAQRWGRLLSFLYIWQTLFQGPLSIASGALGFATYSRYLVGEIGRATEIVGAFGTHGDNVIAGAIIVLVVVLLYRRITEIGRISVVFSVIVVGTILWIIWGGARHFNAHRVFDFSGGGWNFSWLLFAALGHGMVQTIYSYLGYYNVCNLGGEMKNPEKNIPRAIFISIHRDHGALSGDANEHPERDSVARGGAIQVHREHIHRARVREPVGHARDGADSADRARIGFCGDAWIFARAVRGGAGRKLFFDFRARASDETFPVHFAGGARRGGDCFQPAVQNCSP